MKREYIAAVDIGGTKITVSISNIDGIIVKIYQKVKLEGADNKTIPKQVENLINFACNKGKIDIGDIISIGVSTASPFEIRGRYHVVVSPNLCNVPDKNTWEYIPLEEELSEAFPTQKIKIGNDCVTALIAEKLFGAAQNEDNCVYVTWSTGIGLGLCVDGNTLHGKNGNAGHAGHQLLEENSHSECGCGNFGDMEGLVSGTAIQRDFNDSPEKAFDEFQKEDGFAKAKTVIENAIRRFSRGLYNVATTLDTKLFVIGGSVFLNNQKVLLPLIENEFKKYFPAMTKNVYFKSSELHNYLGDIAALSLVMPEQWIKIWNKNTPWQNAPSMIKLNEMGNEV
ncbi:MAG: ROK family protein [Candidatus Cloacimonetes bacterium]|nr:ROK family protein [Candidatus Cloacimonadota bacterium]